MTTESNEIAHLTLEHEFLDHLILQKFENYAPDEEVTQLKLRKLEVKRQIEKLKEDHH